MAALTADMRRVVAEQRLCFVATVSEKGAPNLSPKGTVRVLDDEHFVFVDLRSPQTLRNIQRDPRVEVNVVDPLTRTGYRFAGKGSVHRSGDLFYQSVALYRAEGNTADIRRVVAIRVAHALPIRSPTYDSGADENEVRGWWRSYWVELWDRWGAAVPAPAAAKRAPGAAPPNDAPRE